MRLTLSKQKFILLVGLFLICLIGGVYLLLNNTGLRFKVRRLDKYSELISFCEERLQGGEDFYIDCYAFLESESKDEQGRTCISFVTPYFDKEGVRQDTQVCEEEDKIDWDNPYSNYSLHIPVVMTFRYKKSLLQFYKFEDLKIELMENEKASELWQRVDLLGPMGYKAFRSSGHKTSEELGYNITAEGGPNDVETLVPSGLVILAAEIKSYQVEGDRTLLEIEAFLNEQKTTFTYATDGFYFFDTVGEGADGTPIDSANIGDIDTDVPYRVYFKFKEKELISEGFIGEQLALLTEGKESGLLLDMITVIDGE
jgi:hypothetical protein